MRALSSLRPLGACVAVAVLAASPRTASGQSAGTAGAVPATPAAAPVAARPEDVASADAITAALYAVISGPAGQKRDWDRFRSLFLPEARLIIARARRDSAGRVGHRVLTPDAYAGSSGALEANGFFERELSHVSETFGRVTHRFSTYDSKRRLEDPAPFARGINSIQLLNDGTRWWVVTVYWDSEGPNNPIPQKYLPR